MVCKKSVVQFTHTISTAVIVVLFYATIPAFAYFYTSTANFILYSVFAYHTYCLTRALLLREKLKPDNKAVLITGCDSGFGKNLAKRLDSKGFHVFASCLFPEEKGALELRSTCSEKLQVLPMDVTKDESVEKAVEFVKQNLGNSKLWAVVNNAGILRGFTTELTPIDAYRAVMEVNSIGQVRVTKAFLPLLRASKGRVVNVNSLAGRLTSLGMNAYVMSKHAAVAFTENLSMEMAPWEVSVISIEPEMFRTEMAHAEILDKILDNEFQNINAEVLSSYGEKYVKEMKQHMFQVIKLASPNIHLVLDDIESAIIEKYPKCVYKPRWNLITRLLWYIAEIVPDTIYKILITRLTRFLGFPLPKCDKERKKS